MAQPQDKPSAKKISFFVDNNKYESEQETLLGSQIKALAGTDASFGLVLEGHGQDPDRQIGDDDSVSLTKDQGPLRFFTVPPATFGLQ